MYDNLIGNYRIIHEGREEPVFYGRYYPVGAFEGEHQAELWDHFNYIQGLKKDKDADGSKYAQFKAEYKADLKALLSCVEKDTSNTRRGVIVIPSSKVGNVNRVTELVREVLAEGNGVFADLTENLVRTKQKQAAHEGGSRQSSSNADTLEVQPVGSLADVDLVLVIDDVVSTGSSFSAVQEVL